MGRDKATIRLGHRSMLAHVRAAARATGLPVRVVRRDIIPPCGPLGGIYTALQSSRADAELFLACDMPFVSTTLLRRLLRAFRPGDAACFAVLDRRAGFPCIIRTRCSSTVKARIQRGQLSLQQLAQALKARRVNIVHRDQGCLANINTPAELQSARRQASSRPE